MGCPWLLVHEVSVEQNGFAFGLMARGRFCQKGDGGPFVKGESGGETGYFYEPFHKYVRNVRPKACFGRNLGAGHFSFIAEPPQITRDAKGWVTLMSLPDGRFHYRPVVRPVRGPPRAQGAASAPRRWRPSTA